MDSDCPVCNTPAHRAQPVEEQCGHQSPVVGTICGLPKGHNGLHQRSYNGGKSEWTDTTERTA